MKRYQMKSNARYRKQLEETNDCVIIAISIAARMTYKEAHDICKYQGRINKKRMCTTPALDQLKVIGFKVEQVDRLLQKNGNMFTSKTIGDKLKHGYFICLTRDPAFAVVNGDVEDWTQGRKYVVLEAYKITRRRV